MEIQRTVVSGTLESSDIMITLEKGQGEIEIDLDSTVMKQFGETIRQVIADTLKEAGITSAHVIAKDRGALDCTIRARVQAAVFAANEEDAACGF